MNIVSQFDYQLKNHLIRTIIISLDNAISIYMYENSPRLGSAAFVIPGSQSLPPTTVFSAGIQKEREIKALGEIITKLTNKITFISINVDDNINFTDILKIIKNKILAQQYE